MAPDFTLGKALYITCIPCQYILRLQQNDEILSEKMSEKKSHFHRNASANPTVERAFSHENVLDGWI